MFVSLKELIFKKRARFVNPSVAVLMSVENIWPSIKNSLNLNRAEPLDFKKGVLVLLVPTSAEASHVRLQKEAIKKEANLLLNKNLIQDIKFKIAVEQENTRNGKK